MGEVDAISNPEPRDVIANEFDITKFKDPIWFIENVLVNPESNEPFVLFEQQKTFLRHALTPTADGRLPYSELLYSCPKKTGKTATSAMSMLFIVVALGGPYAEGLCLANDEEQSRSRVFASIARIVEASPLLRASANVYQNKVEFPATGATITALGSDYASAAGSNSNCTALDELWGYRSEKFRRLWDELVPPPTRKIATRLTTSYQGFEGESVLLHELTERGLKGKEIAPNLHAGQGMLAYVTHDTPAPWQTPQWKEQMREQLRPNAYLRLIENREVSSEDSFVDLDQWDRCVDLDASPVLTDRSLPVVIGVDASTKRDSTAIVVCTFDAGAQKVRLVSHRIFQPTPDDPLQFEETVEASLLDYQKRFDVRSVLFDPFAMTASSQRLARAGVPMREYPQSVPNLTASSTALYEAITGNNLVLYADDGLRLAASRAVALETSRGWRIAKHQASHKIDVIVALSMSCLGAIEGQVRDIGPAVAPWEAFRSNPWSDLSDAGEDVMPYARTMLDGRVVG